MAEAAPSIERNGKKNRGCKVKRKEKRKGALGPHDSARNNHRNEKTSNWRKWSKQEWKAQREDEDGLRGRVGNKSGHGETPTPCNARTHKKGPRPK